MQQKNARVAWALIPVTLSALVYFPITANYFWADDFYNLYRIRNVPLGEYLLLPQGNHLMVTTYVIFYLSYLGFGTNPEPYFVSVLAIHLLNVALLFLVIARATGSDRLGCFGALLWGTSPRHAGTLGWYSTFGHALLATALLWLLCDLTTIERSGSARWGMRARWVVLILVAATSFGIGIGVALVFPVVAFLVLPRSRLRTSVVAQFLLTAAAVPLLYIGLHRLFIPGFPIGFVPGSQRPMWYAQFIGLLTHLIGYGAATAPAGTWWPDARYPGALAGVIVTLWCGALLLPLIGGSARSRRYILAALALMVASYAMVAAGRAAWYWDAPETGNSDRYQYVPAAAIILASCVFLGRWIRLPPRWSTGLLVAAVAAVMGGQLALAHRIDHHDDARSETADVLARIRAAVVQAPPKTDVYILNRPFRAMGPIFLHSPVFPGWAGVFVAFFPDNVVDGRRIYFVEPDPRTLRSAARGLRSAVLVVPNAPVGGDARPTRP